MNLGNIVWHDLYTSDPDKAIPFYRDLLGWTISTEEMGSSNNYTMATNAVGPVGGFGPLSSEIDTHPYWNVYFSTPDIDQALERITVNGGLIVHPGFDIPGVGRMAFAKDCAGTPFSPFQPVLPGNPAPWPPVDPVGGVVVWHDHMSDSPQQVAEFYAAVFDIDAKDWSSPDFTCWGLANDDKTVGVVLSRPAPDVPVSWTTYVEAPGEISDVARRVVDLGGQVYAGPMTHPGFGEFIIVGDPTDAAIGIVKSLMWRTESVQP